MRKAFKVVKTFWVSSGRCEETVVRVKLTAYKPARPVTLERFRGIPAMALVREYEEMFRGDHLHM